MKLSEAIRLGAMLKPQGFGEACALLDGELATCALGAAEEAVVGPFTEPSDGGDAELEIYARYAALLRTESKCPACGGEGYVGDIIAWCLNDEHLWTREQIADFVESIEQQQEQPAVASTEVTVQCP